MNINLHIPRKWIQWKHLKKPENKYLALPSSFLAARSQAWSLTTIYQNTAKGKVVSYKPLSSMKGGLSK